MISKKEGRNKWFILLCVVNLFNRRHIYLEKSAFQFISINELGRRWGERGQRLKLIIHLLVTWIEISHIHTRRKWLKCLSILLKTFSFLDTCFNFPFINCQLLRYFCHSWHFWATFHTSCVIKFPSDPRLICTPLPHSPMDMKAHQRNKQMHLGWREREGKKKNNKNTQI